jgi:Pro-kumamolisin, activation domain/Bacterial Ig-like domain (group 3)
MAVQSTNALRVWLICLILPAGVAAQTSHVAPGITSPIDESAVTQLKGNTHPFARPDFEQGTAPPDLPMDRMLLVLKRSPEQETALQKLLERQQDVSSTNYHKWLTPDEFGKQFGPADEDIQNITSWLATRGFHSIQVSHGRAIIEFSGTVSQVERAFRPAMRHYVVNGEDHWANAVDPVIPTALAPVVSGIFTLHNFFSKAQTHFSNEHPFRVSVDIPKPDFTSTTGIHALAPADLATIYNANPLYAANPPITGNPFDGVAIPSRTNVNIQDPVAFRNVFGLYGAVQGSDPYIVTLNGPDPGDLGGGDETEAVLDMSWAGALAPNSAIQLIVSSSTATTDGIFLSELYAIENNVASVMTSSFSFCEADSTTAEASAVSSLAEQAAAQGITFLVSTGDNGALECASSSPGDTTVSINVYASNPYVVAVGGTEFNENGNDGLYWNGSNSSGARESAISYIPEQVWNESQGAGGGGSSIYFAKPSWQSGVPGIPTQNVRFIPDVSLTAANHDPYLFCIHLSCQPNSQGQIQVYAVYGTSAAVQAFGGIMSLVNQKAASRQGQANYVLYQLAAAENLSQCNASVLPLLAASGPCIFNDITIGNNARPGEAGYGTATAPYQSGIGFDSATGLGSVNVANLVNGWSNVHFLGTTTTLQLNNGNPVHIAYGQSVPVSITVTGAGTPTGDVTLGGGSSQYFQDLVLFHLTNGAVNTSTNLLPGGSYRAAALYAGDGTFAPSESTQFPQVTVDSEGSKTSMSVKALDSSGHVYTANGTVPAGDYDWLVSVTNAAGAPCTPGINLPQCPAGTTYLFDNGYNDLPNQSSAAFPQLDSFGNTQVLIHLVQLGQHTLQTNYAGDNNFTSSATTMSINVDGIEIYPNNSFLNVTQGASGTITLTVLTANYSGPVNFNSSSCLGLPSLATCSFSPSSIVGSGQAVLTISTQPKTSSLGAERPGGFRSTRPFWLPLMMALTLYLLSFGAKLCMTAQMVRRVALACVLVAFVGCGGSSTSPSSSGTQSSPGTPTGAYTVTINASGGGFSSSTSFTLNVQ